MCVCVSLLSSPVLLFRLVRSVPLTAESTVPSLTPSPKPPFLSLCGNWVIKSQAEGCRELHNDNRKMKKVKIICHVRRNENCLQGSFG